MLFAHGSNEHRNEQAGRKTIGGKVYELHAEFYTYLRAEVERDELRQLGRDAEVTGPRELRGFDRLFSSAKPFQVWARSRDKMQDREADGRPIVGTIAPGE